jgi:hypothetical protein
MKFIVTHEVRVTRDVEIEAPDVKAAFFAACVGVDALKWRETKRENSLDCNVNNDVEMAVLLASKTVRCAGCDGSDFATQGEHDEMFCTYCGLTG